MCQGCGRLETQDQCMKAINNPNVKNIMHALLRIGSSKRSLFRQMKTSNKKPAIGRTPISIRPSSRNQRAQKKSRKADKKLEKNTNSAIFLFIGNPPTSPISGQSFQPVVLHSLEQMTQKVEKLAQNYLKWHLGLHTQPD